TASSPSRSGEQVVVTDREGFYRLTDLVPGTYALRFERESYRPYTRHGVVITPERTLRLNVELLPETAGMESVTVVGTPPDDLGPIGPRLGLLPPQTFVDISPRVGGREVDSEGLDLAFDAPRPQTVKSGPGATRVGLVSEAWPVEVERRV